MAQTQKQLDNLPARPSLKLAPPQRPRGQLPARRNLWLGLGLLGVALSLSIYLLRRDHPAPVEPIPVVDLDLVQGNTRAVQIYREQGAAAALNPFKELAERFPNNAGLLSNLGIAQLTGGSPPEAEG